MSEHQPRVYTATEVACMFHVSASFVCKHANQYGEFHGVRVIRIGRRVLFSRDGIDRVLADYAKVAA